MRAGKKRGQNDIRRRKVVIVATNKTVAQKMYIESLKLKFNIARLNES